MTNTHTPTVTVEHLTRSLILVGIAAEALQTMLAECLDSGSNTYVACCPEHGRQTVSITRTACLGVSELLNGADQDVLNLILRETERP